MLLEKLENSLMRESTKLTEILFEEDNKVLNQLVRSDFLLREYGVTNRSVLIPPLFLVFVNNIQESCGDSSATLLGEERFVNQNACRSKLNFPKSLE